MEYGEEKLLKHKKVLLAKTDFSTNNSIKS
jgi:hypothetical protein